jgi:hypothetical protein
MEDCYYSIDISSQKTPDPPIGQTLILQRIRSPLTVMKVQLNLSTNREFALVRTHPTPNIMTKRLRQSNF